MMVMSKDLLYKGVTALFSGATKLVSRTHVLNMQYLPQSHEKTVLVMNHISNVDPIIVAGTIGRKVRIYALAKESLFRTPIVGAALRGMRHIPVHRNTENAKQALSSAIEAVNSGKLVGLYPEGTVVEEGKPHPYKTGAARLAIATCAQVLPVGQWGAQQVIPHSPTPWKVIKGIVSRPRCLLIIGAPLEPQDDETIATFTQRIQETVTELSSMAREVLTN